VPLVAHNPSEEVAMARLKNGFKLLVVLPDSTVAGEVDISDTDLAKPIAASVVIQEIRKIAEQYN
jgi:hypothetical protein